MSQQEFQSQAEESTQAQAEEEVYVRPRPSKKKTGAMPKSEHPSTYEESIPPYSYRAQDTNTREPDRQQANQQARQEERQQANQQPRAGRQGFSPDGDAFETGYRPYQRMVPPWAWARAQRGPRSTGRLVFLVILAVILLPVLFKVLTFLLAALAIVFFSFLFFALIALAIAAALFFALRRSLRWPRRTMWRW